jgi:hypothetical protein
MTQFNERLKEFTLHRNAKGCSADELASLKDRHGYSLPESYIQFMAAAGNGVEDFLRGSDFRYNQVDDMREAADQLLLEGGLKPLDASDFVFSMHQGYQFYFFHNGGVYYFMEGAENIEKRHDSFEEFFDAVLSDIEKRKQSRNS